jgi:hypothetical protein
MHATLKAAHVKRKIFGGGKTMISHGIWLVCLGLAAWICVRALVNWMQEFNDDPGEISLGRLAAKATLLFFGACFFAGWFCVETTKLYEDIHAQADPAPAVMTTPAPLTNPRPIARPSPLPQTQARTVQGKETPVGQLIRAAAGASNLRKQVVLFGLRKLLQTK